MSEFEVVVKGYSTSLDDWARANRVPRDELPSLTEEQKKFARKYGVPEEDFARSVLAGRYGSERLCAEADRFARVLQEAVHDLRPQQEIEIVQVIYSSFDRRFTCHLREGSNEFTLYVSSTQVADHLDSGDSNLRKTIKEILREKIQQARTQAVGAGG